MPSGLEAFHRVAEIGAPERRIHITGGPFLPSAAGPWKWAIVAGPESRL
jgi:hypothetical protein